MFGKLLRGSTNFAPPDIPLIFSLPAVRHLRIQGYEPTQVWRFLSHHVQRYPRDLRAHTQRILLAQEAVLQDRLAGSLQDLFISLGIHGRQLRQHLFDTVKNNLIPEDQEFFQRWLASENEPKTEQKCYKGCLLGTEQPLGSAKLIEIERSTQAAQYSNIMEEVVACLEYGQIDTAKDLLETELFAGRADQAMAQELASIYQYTRNKEGLNAMINYFQTTGHTVPLLWMQMQQESEQW